MLSEMSCRSPIRERPCRGLISGQIDERIMHADGADGGPPIDRTDLRRRKALTKRFSRHLRSHRTASTRAASRRPASASVSTF
jgi:hypothetical protein